VTAPRATCMCGAGPDRSRAAGHAAHLRSRRALRHCAAPAVSPAILGVASSAFEESVAALSRAGGVPGYSWRGFICVRGELSGAASRRRCPRLLLARLHRRSKQGVPLCAGSSAVPSTLLPRPGIERGRARPRGGDSAGSADQHPQARHARPGACRPVWLVGLDAGALPRAYSRA
jgi:hypothetical protein